MQEAPKTGSSGQGGAKLAPKAPKGGSKTASIPPVCHTGRIGPNQGDQNEQDRNSCTPDVGSQGGVARYRDGRCRKAGKQPPQQQQFSAAQSD